jgi:hypothetical protein
MRIAHATRGSIIAVACLLCGSTEALRLTPLTDSDPVHTSIFPSRTGPNLLYLLMKIDPRGANAMGKPGIDPGLPCATSHRLENTASTKERAPPKPARLRAAPVTAKVSAAATGKKAAGTPRIVKTASASTTKIPISAKPASLTKAPTTCLAACGAECGVPGGKKGKSACGPVYDDCVAAC